MLNAGAKSTVGKLKLETADTDGGSIFTHNMTVDEQLEYLTRGCVDVVRASELREKLERARIGVSSTIES